MNYKIVPNFLSKEQHEFIRDKVMYETPLYYQANVAKTGDNSTFFFCEKLYCTEIKKIIDPKHFKIIIPLLYKAGIQLPYRLQINCYIKQPNHIFTEPHTDDPRPHNVLLYALNTNNGFTVLDPKGKNVKIPSVANQALFFDGKIEHQAVTQTDENVRYNINVNFH